MSSMIRLALSCVALLAIQVEVARAADLKIALTQAQAGDARKYQPLLAYLAKKGVSASFVRAPDNRAAAEMFAAGQVDAMFGGSGVAATMLIKGLADPSLRPVNAQGPNTYAAVVIAPKGSPRFDGAGGYFEGKRVIFAALASAGEFFFRSLGPSKPAAALKAASHGAALDALARGQADVAILKNHVWTKEKGNYPALELVGGDSGENPDGAVILSKKLAPAKVQELSSALLALEADPSPEAAQAKKSLGIRGYSPASAKDFAHTVDLLTRAGVTKDFTFTF
jgi:ABC-type phosphate/phosphonate transport system substrate-binding protein